MFIECTKKLFDAMKIKPNDIVSIYREPFYEWHANLFIFDRRKGVILMNNKTRYCIILYGLKAEHLKKFDAIVLSAIKETFIAEGFSTDKVEFYISHCAEVIYTKTHDRSILSQMNEFYFHISWEIENHLPNENVNLIELNKWAGDLMCGSLGYAHPIDLLKKEMNEINVQMLLYMQDIELSQYKVLNLEFGLLNFMNQILIKKLRDVLNGMELQVNFMIERIKYFKKIIRGNFDDFLI